MKLFEELTTLYRIYIPKHASKKYIFAGLYGSFLGAVVCGVLGVATVPDNLLGIGASALVGAFVGFPVFLRFVPDKNKNGKH